MAIESIQMPKAPADWKPSADQQAQIANDPRLRGMSRDELYLHFQGGGSSFSGAFHARAKQQQAQPQESVFSRLSKALGGS